MTLAKLPPLGRANSDDEKTTHAGPMSRRMVRFFVLLGCVAVLSACKSGGLSIGSIVIDTPSPQPGYNYASPYPAPAPVNPSVLTTTFNGLQSFSPAIVAAADSLLASSKYLLQQSTWYATNGSGGQIGPTYYSYPLKDSGVAYAHALGLTGAGQTVSVVDTQINPNHEVFAGKSITISDTLLPAGATATHGTAVSSIIAGQSSTFIGVAPGASLQFGSFTSDQTTTTATLAAIASNAVAQNNSWGFDTLDISASSYDAIFNNTSGQAYLGTLRTYANQGVVVFAVSNDTNRTHASLMEALPYVDSGLEAGWIAVANATPTMGANGKVASVAMQSSSCLEAARWCILADGAWTGATSTSNSSYSFMIGSSFAAPQVSGALALLAEAFPTLTPHQLRVRLLAAADNKFFTPDATVQLATGFNKGYSYQYGVGFLNVGAALLPIGASQMSLPGGVKQNIDRPIVVSGAAFGDAVARSLTNVEVSFTDALDTGFSKPAQSLTATAAPLPLASQILARSLTADLTDSRINLYANDANPFADYGGQSYAVRDPAGLMQAAVLMPTGSDGSYGLNLAKTLGDGPTQVALGLKLAHDQGSVMGFGGTDGQSGADLVSVQLGLAQDLGQSGFLTMGAEFGLASLGTQAALSNVSAAGFNSVSVSFGNREVFARGDKLAFGVSMPIAVTSGHADLAIPVSGRSSREAFSPVNLDLSPADRQVDMSISYQRPLAPGLELAVELVHAENYGNRAGQRDTAGALALKFEF